MTIETGQVLLQRELVTSGATIRYWLRERTDCKKWVVFIHGAGVDHRMFLDQLEIFEGSYNLLLPDMRGQGESTLESGKSALFDDIVHDIERLCKRHGIHDAIVIAQSFGAAVAQEFALLHPDRVSRLVLIGAYNHHRKLGRSIADRPRIVLTRLLLRILPWPMLAAWFARLSSRNVKTAAYIRDGLVATGRSTWESLGTSAFASMHEVEYYPKPHPTLVIRGEHDSPRIFPAIHEAMVRYLPDCRAAVIPNAGHSCNQDDPAATNRVISAFLDTDDSGCSRAASNPDQ